MCYNTKDFSLLILLALNLLYFTRSHRSILRGRLRIFRYTKKKWTVLSVFNSCSIRCPVDFICCLLFVRTTFRTSYEDLKCTLRPVPVSEFSSVFRKRQLSRCDTFLLRLVGNANYTSAVATRACRSSNAHKLHLFSLLSSFFSPYHDHPLAFATNLSQWPEVKRNLSGISQLSIKPRTCAYNSL